MKPIILVILGGAMLLFMMHHSNNTIDAESVRKAVKERRVQDAEIKEDSEAVMQSVHFRIDRLP